MTFGVILPNKGHGSGPAELDAAASVATDLGWRSAWVTDHLMVPRGPEADEYGWMLEALTTLAWVGGRHEELVVGTSVVSPAMRDAPMLAKELATLDVLLGGRLVVGVGVSDTDDLPEYRNMGKEDRFRVRGRYVDESMRLWRHLWSGSTEPFEGEFHTLDDFMFAPLPTRRDIPIWAGGRSARALRRTAEFGDGYHAAQTGPADLEERLPQLREAMAVTGRPFPVVSTRARVKFQAEPSASYSIFGDPEAMIAEVLKFAAVGNDELILVFEGHDAERFTENARRFDREVIRPAAERIAAG
jgi:alkanesulfonate monooxygenase SsuD/methylene tetrahydromethanopterin reductase-like flavin-dependent oxidoreductase (luciferase family)